MSASKTVAETERLLVEMIDLDDAPLFFNLMNSAGWQRFIGNRSIDTIDAAEATIEQGYLASYRTHGFGYYKISTRDDLEPVGICGFLKRDTLTNPDFGFAMLPNHEGQGLAFEACHATLNYGERTYGFKELDAITNPTNTRAINLLEKLRFRVAGTFRHEDGDEPLLLYRWQRREH